MSLTFNGSSVIHRLEHSDVTEIRDGITCYMYFYMGQPHIYDKNTLPAGIPVGAN